MCENLCRICGKTIKEKDPINLFEDQNEKILLQIKDLTGTMLKNNPSLPKFMCCACKYYLIDAYKFREDFLTVQESFRIIGLRATKRHTHKCLIEATEKDENIYVGNDEEEEINIGDSEDLNKKKNLCNQIKDEINALELKRNQKNTLEDPRAAIEEVIKNKVDSASDTSKIISEDEEFISFDSDEEYKPEAEIRTKKPKTKCDPKSKNSECPANDKRENIEDKEDTNIICDQCGKKFRTRDYLKLHLRRHSGDKRFACELCPHKCVTSAELSRHMRKHTGEKPFACKCCHRRFADITSRLRHERTHTNERPYMCSVCGKSFTTSNILKYHMVTHTGERQFKCDVCNKAFKRETALLMHFRSLTHKQAVEKEKQSISPNSKNSECPANDKSENIEDKEDTNIICDQCGKKFRTRDYLKLHLKRHLGVKRFACELCPYKCFTSAELRAHMRRHTGEKPFGCKYCDRRFAGCSERLYHERTHTNERPFMCSVCSKSFTTSNILKTHMLTHTGERHFKCDVCNRAFGRRTALVMHFKSLTHKQAVEKEKHTISQP